MSNPVLIEANDDDVKVYLRDGRVLESPSYTLIEDATVNVGGLVFHLGKAVKVNGEVYPVSFVSKVTAKVIRIEEVIVFNGNAFGVGSAAVAAGKLKKKLSPADITPVDTNTYTGSFEDDGWKVGDT